MGHGHAGDSLGDAQRRGLKGPWKLLWGVMVVPGSLSTDWFRSQLGQSHGGDSLGDA